MAEILIADRIACELKDQGKRRIQVRNVLQPNLLLTRLSSLMEDTRFIAFSFFRSDPLRETLYDYFTGNGLPDIETAFDAGWRSHVTETALLRGGSGMEAAAGLSSLRKPFRDWLFGETNSFDSLPRILASFSGTLPTVFLLLDYRGHRVFESESDGFPPIVALAGYGGGLSCTDLDIDSGLISLSSAREYLMETRCEVPVEKVLQASEDRADLVMLYAGLSNHYKVESDSVWEMLHRVLDRDSDLAMYASAAAVLAPGFIPHEAGILSGISRDHAFPLGRKVNLWRGFLVADFLSPRVRDEILKRTGEQETTRLLIAGAETVLQLRGASPVSLGYAGELLFRAGAGEEASALFRKAADMEPRELKKAGLYMKALLSNGRESEELTFRSRLSHFREKTGSAPQRIPDNLDRNEFPELSQVFQLADETFRAGRYHESYKLLADFALEGEKNIPLALIEIGRQLLHRNMVESSLNVMKVATASARFAGSVWIEALALEVLMKACNRAGRFGDSEKASGRLLELALDSGNRLKLVSACNLFANALILQTEYEKALRVYQASLRTLDDDQHGLRAVILNNMSVAQRRLFRTEEALGSLMRFARSAVSQGNLMQASTAYGNLARLFVDLSRFDSAADCLETMIEFRKIAGAEPYDDSVLFISSQIAFANGQIAEALHFIDEAIGAASISGNLRRLSLNLVKKGSMLLRKGEYSEAGAVLCMAENASIQSSSMLNAFVARMKGTAARCFSGDEHPASLLAVELSGTPEDTHRGEQFYYHWRLTGSRQSLAAAVQFLSRGLSTGLHFHSYLYMLHEIVAELPPSLADAFPLVHNYPSCDQVKGD